MARAGVAMSRLEFHAVLLGIVLLAGCRAAPSTVSPTETVNIPTIAPYAVSLAPTVNVAATAPPAVSPAPTIGVLSEEYAVYAAVLNLRYHSPETLLLIRPNVYMADDPGPGARSRFAAKVPDLSPEVFDNFSAQEQALRQLQPELQLKSRYILFTDAEPESFKGEDGWEAFYATKYPDAVGIIFLSQVGLNQTMDQAFVCVGFRYWPLAGDGTYYYLRKVDGAWRVEAQELAWQE